MGDGEGWEGGLAYGPCFVTGLFLGGLFFFHKQSHHQSLTNPPLKNGGTGRRGTSYGVFSVTFQGRLLLNWGGVKDMGCSARSR